MATHARPAPIGLSPAQLRNRMIVSARRIIGEHWPRVDRCPVCGCGWPCPPTDTAYDYLTSVGQGNWVPPQRAGGRR
ncbi:hypothetical protein [Salinispora arenicola]|uniref:Uncharacterized protein n=1 Tax=Salinispora arenicola TaxID=168697 RepID=A0A542XM64_SALAC|nr:hypothetical protein [Salinispora arenicola]TQL36945.1 hypothetical protein FB564_2083 [Salinispora arenicola]